MTRLTDEEKTELSHLIYHISFAIRKIQKLIDEEKYSGGCTDRIDFALHQLQNTYIRTKNHDHQ